MALTSSQNAQLSALGKQYNQAAAAGDTAGMQVAHDSANAIRSSAGLTAGKDYNAASGASLGNQSAVNSAVQSAVGNTSGSRSSNYMGNAANLMTQLAGSLVGGTAGKTLAAAAPSVGQYASSYSGGGAQAASSWVQAPAASAGYSWTGPNGVTYTFPDQAARDSYIQNYNQNFGTDSNTRQQAATPTTPATVPATVDSTIATANVPTVSSTGTTAAPSLPAGMSQGPGGFTVQGTPILPSVDKLYSTYKQVFGQDVTPDVQQYLQSPDFQAVEGGSVPLYMANDAEWRQLLSQLGILNAVNNQLSQQNPTSSS